MISKSLQDTHSLAARLAKTLKGGDVLGLIGPLGAGKTTFVQGLAKALKIKRKITSPTFILMQSYRVPQSSPPKKVGTKRGCRIMTLTHVDCYRLNNPQELIDIGIRDHLNDPYTLTLIEWADKVVEILPQRTFFITMCHNKGETRSIILDKRFTSSYANTRIKSHPASHRKPRR